MAAASTSSASTKKFGWTETESFPAAAVRCIWHTRLVIPADRTASGTRYEFEPGEIKDIDARDLQLLLAMVKNQSACCGGMKAAPLRYFEEA